MSKFCCLLLALVVALALLIACRPAEPLVGQTATPQASLLPATPSIGQAVTQTEPPLTATGTPHGAVVGLFSGAGAEPACSEAASRMFAWMGYIVEELDAQAVNHSDLEPIDIFYFPGGSTGPYQEYITEEGREKIRQRVRSGACFIGTCAGALFAAEQIIWNGRQDARGSLGLFPGIAQGPAAGILDNSEFGMCQLELSRPHPITDGQPDIMQIMYYNSPFFIPNPGAQVEVIARFQASGDIAIVASYYGQGRVFLTGPHPEWEEDSDRDGVSFFDYFDDAGSDWPLMRAATQWCLGVE